jgi:prolipoprotein diacylglyceryltransferase
LVIPWHLVFETAAYAVGFGIYHRERRRRGDFLADSGRSSVIVAAILGAAVGSKVLAWANDPGEPLWPGGKTIVGGLLGGTMAVEWIKWRLGIKRRTGDLFAIPIVVGIAVGRIGCFLDGLNDHTYGVATALPWGVDFGDGIKRHPVQLYEVAFLAVLGAVLLRIHGREGARYRVLLICYLAFRLGIDFLKPDPTLAGLSAIQWACVAALCWYGREMVHG